MGANLAAMASLTNRSSSCIAALVSLVIAIVISMSIVGYSYAAETTSEGAPSSAPATQVSQSKSSYGSSASDNAAVEQIEDDENALSAGNTSTWALVDLVCGIGTLALSVGLLASISKRRLRGVIQLRHVVLGGLSTVPALVAIATLSFTQDFAMPMSITDEMSIFFAVLFAANAVIVFAANVKQRFDDHNDLDLNKPDMANAAA